MGEIRTVDDDEKVGIGRHDSVRGGGDPSEDRRKPGDDRREAHHGNVFEGKRLTSPSPAMAWPPTPPQARLVSPRRAFRARMSFAPS